MAAFEVSDLIVAVSGNQVYSSGKFGWPLPVTLAPLFLAKHFGKPLVVFPQSIGPLKRKWERKMVKRAYEYASKVFVRDDKSLALLKELGFPKEKYAYAPDPAFGLRAAPADAALQILSEAGMADDKFRIGLTVISRMGKALDQDNISRYYQIRKWACWISIGKTVQIVLLPRFGAPELENDSIQRGTGARLKRGGSTFWWTKSLINVAKGLLRANGIFIASDCIPAFCLVRNANLVSGLPDQDRRVDEKARNE